MAARLTIYCDTCTLGPNIRGKNSSFEMAAIERLIELAAAHECSLVRSHIVWAELEKTSDPQLRDELKRFFELMQSITFDEKLNGINTVSDYYGGQVIPILTMIDRRSPNRGERWT